MNVKKNENPIGGTHWVAYFIAVLLIVAAAVLLLPKYREYQKKAAERNELAEKLNARESEAARLNSEVTALADDPAAVEKVAREKYKLCRDGERVMRYTPPKTGTAQLDSDNPGK
ncbi:MAG: septum formation initiator family protein [Victivallaceae bacterium]|nr:septum formation initiator family protein [Victivallaceae bacterium]